MFRFATRDVLLLTVVAALAGLIAFGCGVRFGGGGMGGSDSEDVTYYPPGPELRNAQENAQTTADTREDFNPDVARLAALSSLDDAASEDERLRIVSRLAREHKWGVRGLDADKPFGPDVQVIVLAAGAKKHVAVVIHYLPLVVPGPDVQLVALLGPDGELLDQMTCEISSRLTAANIGQIQYEARLATEPATRENFVTIYVAGAKGAEVSANFECTLQHRGKTTKAPLPPQSGKEKWTIDLCHCKVKDGTFVVTAASMNE